MTMTAIEALKQTAADLDQYLKACEDARYCGGPTIYPQSPFSEKWAGNLCKHIRSITTETQGVELEWVPPETCDDKEQLAFETWAKSQGMKMDEHPMLYLFLDKETAAARNGWREAIRWVRQEYESSLTQQERIV